MKALLRSTALGLVLALSLAPVMAQEATDDLNAGAYLAARTAGTARACRLCSPGTAIRPQPGAARISAGMIAAVSASAIRNPRESAMTRRTLAR